MADDLGWGDVGYNGNREIMTPNIDQMSKDGIRFTRYYTAAPCVHPPVEAFSPGGILSGLVFWLLTPQVSGREK